MASLHRNGRARVDDAEDSLPIGYSIKGGTVSRNLSCAVKLTDFPMFWWPLLTLQVLSSDGRCNHNSTKLSLVLKPW